VYGDLSGRWGGFAEYVLEHEDSFSVEACNNEFRRTACVNTQASNVGCAGVDLIRNNFMRGVQSIDQWCWWWVVLVLLDYRSPNYNGIEITGR
jgi:hypothetical protein